MKKGWEVKRLGDLCNIELGRTPFRDNKLFWDPEKKTDNVWLSIADLLNAKNNIVSDSKEYISEKAKEGAKLVKEGTLLLSFKLTLGRMAFAGRDLFTNEAIAALTILDNSIIDKFYLFYYLTYFDWNKASEGDVKVKGRTLNKTKLNDIKILFPKSLDLQKSIVDYLCKAFDGITKAKINTTENLQNAKKIFESYLQSLFTNTNNDWDEKKLKEIGETQTGTTPSTLDKSNFGYYVPFIKPADIDYLGNGEIRYDNEGLSEEGLKNSRTILQNSILMVCIGASIGKVGFSNRIVSCNQQVNCLTVSKELYPKFFYYALRTKAFFEQVIKDSSQATLPIINKSKWANLNVTFPKSIANQKQIVDSLDALSIETKKLESLYQKKLTYLDEFKKSILQKAFNGELKTLNEIAI